MQEMMKIRNELLAKKVISGINSRNMTGYYAKDKKEALDLALSLIKKGSKIAWGGSVSVNEIGLIDALKSGDYKIIDRNNAKSDEEKEKLELETFGCDYFLLSTNAITEDGILVNIDGNANRVAALCYGPKHIVMIVGMNKIAKDVDSAVNRARNIAATTNAQRFPLDTPCKANGSCANCKSCDTICCQFLITRFSRHKDRIHIILVNDELGF